MRKLRIKMIAIAVAAVLVIFALMTLLITVSMRLHYTQQADAMTNVIAANGGSVPMLYEFQAQDQNGNDLPFGFRYNAESAYRTRYFLVYYNGTTPNETNVEHIAAITEEESLAMAKTALSLGRQTGYVDTYRFRLAENDSGCYVLFLDCSESMTTQSNVLWIIFAVFVVFMLLLSAVFAICSKYVLQPFEENSRRQKQFITDASHELKTPLAIISANAELLEYKNGSNQWTETITGEVQHMSKMISELLTLSKLEELDDNVQTEPLDLCAVIRQTAGKFEEVAARKGASLHIELPQECRMNGNPDLLAELVSILTENAAKYVNGQGKVELRLRQTGKKAVFTVYNTAVFETPPDCDRLFDRFYRTDSARSSQTGGQGIGRSVARRITALHGGSISAALTEGGICFTAVLSTALKAAVKKRKA